VIANETVTAESNPARLRQPTQADGTAVWVLVDELGSLDRNSTYAYLLLCRDFSETCILAEDGGSGALLGFIMGYRLPAQPDTVFVWQVAVSEKARGQGLASRLLDGLLLSDGCRGVRYLESTVTPSNTASRALFGALARRLDTKLVESSGFPAESFPTGDHEPEPRLRIGPFDAARLRNAAR